jgi:Fanconi-associated nuclease 1
MVLSQHSPSKHNSMLGKWIKNPKSTNFEVERDRSPKRRRLNDDSPRTPPAPRFANREIPDSDAEDDDEPIEEVEVKRQTDLESALPPVNTDAEAIEEYEVFKASQQEQEQEQTDDAGGRLKDRKWIRGKSSIYVDAFNLALDTVLDEESHLFDEAEMEVFKQWRKISYEAQYLYEHF